MVLPFWAVVGSFLGMIATWICSHPILVHNGQLPHWQSGQNAIETQFSNYMDVYMSVGLGLSIAIALIGFFQVFRSLRRRNQVTPKSSSVSPQSSFFHRLLHPPASRGSISRSGSGIAIYLFSTTAYIAATHWLVPAFPLWILLAYGFVYTPIVSYVAARMEGVVGQWVDIPMVREAGFILSQRWGYSGVGIWFAPLPLNNYAGSTLGFRTMELTGTSFRSIIKAELIIFPVIMLSSILFSQYLWSIAPIPSAVYPYANQFWELNARQQALTMSSTLGGQSPFYQAIKAPYIFGAAGAGIAIFSLLSAAGLGHALLGPGPRPGRRPPRRPGSPQFAGAAPRPLLLRTPLRPALAAILRPRAASRFFMRHGPDQHVIAGNRADFQSGVSVAVLIGAASVFVLVAAAHRVIMRT